jgi:hypothetical protein
MVVLNSIEAIRQILDKDTAKSADRPPSLLGDYVEGRYSKNLLMCVSSLEFFSLIFLNGDI